MMSLSGLASKGSAASASHNNGTGNCN